MVDADVFLPVVTVESMSVSSGVFEARTVEDEVVLAGPVSPGTVQFVDEVLFVDPIESSVDSHKKS